MSAKAATYSLLLIPCLVLIYFVFVKCNLRTGSGAPDAFTYSFSDDAVLQESGAPFQSSSPYWWLNSGGELIVKGGLGETIEGSLASDSPWYALYKANNPTDTDSGTHPQNIFRLVTQNSWKNFTEECYYRVTASNNSASPNRNESNGLLLFNRYQDGDNLYYAGLRVDGQVTIKKKYQGTYYTMALIPTLDGGLYSRSTNPNLIPKGTWIGLRTVVRDDPDGTVSITLYMDHGHTGMWQEVASATDDGVHYGGPVIDAAGHGGLRTDFMDVQFDDFRMQGL